MSHLRLLIIGVAGLLWGQSGLAAPRPLTGRAAAAGKITPLFTTNEPVYHVQRVVKPPAIDGQADDWKGVPAMVLDKKEQSGGDWNGPADLSGSLRMLWDDQGLYFLVEVTDDVHSAPNAEQNLWENDCIQFAFDPYLSGPSGGYNPEVHSYLVSDSPKGPFLVAYRLPGILHDTETKVPGCTIKMSVQPNGVHVFEWAMPWSQLNWVSPWILGRSGFGFTINDNDGKGFKGALAWCKGIIWGQDASKLGQIVFDGVADTRAAMLPLPPECPVAGTNTLNQWLQVSGAAPWNAARLLVRSPRAESVEAQVNVYRAGDKEPVATGALRHPMPAGQTVVFSWDIGDLSNGQYEVAYSVPTLGFQPDRRLSFYNINLDQLRARQPQLRERFGTDRPWDDLAAAPALDRRHRGLVAATLQLLNGENWGTMVTNPDVERFNTLGYVAGMIEALYRGEDFLGRQRGVFLAAYYSPADGSGQWFVLSLPKEFDPSKTYPLVVTLHGAGGVPTIRDSSQTDAMTWIEVMPWGRGITGYRGLGEIDVLDVIAYLQQWYHIDPARVYVTGASMGGHGTWRMATRHPDLFAAAGPICGGGDVVPLENLRNVPVFNQHGDKDWTVPIELSRYAVSALEDLNYTVIHKEVAGASHSITGLYPVRDWLLSLRRPDQPAAVTFTCYTPEPLFNHAYWLAIRQFTEPHHPARVNARVTGHGPQQTLTLGLANVAVLELDTTAMPVDRQADLLVQIDRDFLQCTSPVPAKLFVTRQGEHWQTAGQWTSPASETRPYRVGAAAQLFTGEPLMVVYGTKASDDRVKVLREAAQNASKFPGSWRDMPAGRFPIKADRDVTAADLARYNLVVIGGAKENELTARILGKLPLRITEKHELVAGGRDPVSLDGAGLRLCYYNPLAPQRLAFLIVTDEDSPEARAWLGKVRELLNGSGEDHWGDTPDLVVEGFKGAARRRMQFTDGWQWRKLPGSDRPAPAAFAGLNQLARANLPVMRRAAGADYAMSWGDPAEPPAYDPKWFTLADLMTDDSPRQTLVGGMTGAELLEVQQKWVARGEAIVDPAVDPKTIDPNRVYRVALPPHFCWRLKDRQKNLLDPYAGPNWRAEDLWKEVFPDR